MDLDNDIIWKDIVGYEGIYQISKYGVVRRIQPTKRKPTRKRCNDRDLILSGAVSVSGYPTVALSKGDGTRKKNTYQIHRLVATHFIPNPHNYPFVDHINAIKLDSFYKNLRWCTQKMNVGYMFEAGRDNRPYGERHYRAILTDNDVIEIKKLYSTGEYTHKQLGKIYKIDRTAIGAVLSGKTWKQVQ